jgi:small GTP-binding protein
MKKSPMPSEIPQPTRGVDFRRKLIPESSCYLDIWDTSGDVRYRELMRANFYGCGDGFLFVFDVTSRKSFESVHEYLECCGSHELELESPLFILVGNKTDLRSPQDLPPDHPDFQDHPDHVSADEATGLAQLRNMHYVETSALDATSVANLFNQVAILLCAGRPHRPL